MKNRVNTVNVVLYYGNFLQWVVSFNDTEEGNAEAEDFFWTEIIERSPKIFNQLTEEDEDDILADGWFKSLDFLDPESIYEIYIVYSGR